MLILHNCSLSLVLDPIWSRLPGAIQTYPIIRGPPDHGPPSSGVKERGSAFPSPGNQGRQSRALPSGPGEATEVEKPPWRPQGPLVSSSWPSTFPGGAQSLGLQAARERRSSGRGGADYSIVWEELNLSISVSISASERRLWEQNHRKRKKPAREKRVSGRLEGETRGLT